MSTRLAALTTLRLGGPAERLVEARDEAQLLAEGPSAALVLGGGSNVVLPDEGVAGTTLLVRTSGVRLQAAGATVTVSAAAGEGWDGLVARTVGEGLAGLEALAGIPGLVGATPLQNVGAYGQDVSQTIVRVRALDRRSGVVRELGPAECGFGYRDSAFKADPARWLVLEVSYRLAATGTSTPIRYAELARALDVPIGAGAPLEDVRTAVLKLRRAKGMVLDPADPDTRSAGSFFTNPVLAASAYAELRSRLGEVPGFAEPDGRTKVSAAWLIERAGFTRGYGSGPVGLSSKHVLALVHRGGGTTADVLARAREIRDRVLATSGVELLPEPVLVGGLRL